jgi:hypothetical protein
MTIVEPFVQKTKVHLTLGYFVRIVRFQLCSYRVLIAMPKVKSTDTVLHDIFNTFCEEVGTYVIYANGLANSYLTDV